MADNNLAGPGVQAGHIKHRFINDYSELAHPEIITALASAGIKQFNGYGLDEASLRAAELIKSRLGAPSVDVHFISGGTQTNMVVLSSMLRPIDAVIAPVRGHISIHETGAIEATGHKICTTGSTGGKLDVAEIDKIVLEHDDEHMVIPRVVYISQSTECGTVYTKRELTAISEYCRKNKLYLYIDGARLGAALNSPACDLTYNDITNLADAFYIGGTKNGALFGEAIVICNDELKVDFRHVLKQRGAMLAKGASVGLQFEAFFKDGLYDRIAARTNELAHKMAAGIKAAGYGFQYPAETNQLFPVFPAEIADKLHKLYDFYNWLEVDGGYAARIVLSWATQESTVDEFLRDLAAL